MNLTEIQFKKRLNLLTQKILRGEPFAAEIEAFYVQLQKARRHELILRTYDFLQILLPAKTSALTAYPALVEALYACGHFKKAKELEKELPPAQSDGNTPLQPYTPLARFSTYAGRAPSVANTGANKTPLNPSWQRGIVLLQGDGLAQYDYNRKCKQLDKTPPKYRIILRRDFEELVLNHLFGNYKSVIVLSGSLMETLLVYRLKKMKITHVKTNKPGQTIQTRPSQLLNTKLNDLLIAAAEYKLIPSGNLTLSHAARIYRNLVHPGRELAGQETLSYNKAQICLLSVLEMIDALLPLPNKI